MQITICKFCAAVHDWEIHHKREVSPEGLPPTQAGAGSRFCFRRSVKTQVSVALTDWAGAGGLEAAVKGPIGRAESRSMGPLELIVIYLSLDGFLLPTSRSEMEAEGTC